MAIEKELKYLIANDSWQQLPKSVNQIEQGFLTTPQAGATVIRVRITDATKAILCVKAPTVIPLDGIPEKQEFEYQIPLEDGLKLLELARTTALKTIIPKTRYTVNVDGYNWEIDVFGGALAGLVVAELEKISSGLPFPPPVLPSFVGRDVTRDMRYTNFMLAANGIPSSEEELGLR